MHLEYRYALYGEYLNMIFETVIAAIIAFIGTNIDDIFINMFFFAQADTKSKTKFIVWGKYLGIGVLVLLSFLGAYGFKVVMQKYIRFLGLVPIALGVKEWFQYLKNKKRTSTEQLAENDTRAKGLVLNVALVTMANGADNIGVYVPLFAAYSMAQMATVLLAFTVMIALWCFLGKKLSDLSVLRNFLMKYKWILIPVVFILLGLYILIK